MNTISKALNLFPILYRPIYIRFSNYFVMFDVKQVEVVILSYNHIFAYITRIYFWFLHTANNWNKEKRIIILTSEWCVYELAEVTKDLFCFNIFFLNKCYNLTALCMISDLKALRSMGIGCTFQLMGIKTNESIESGCVQRFYCMNTPQSDPQL